MRDVVKTKSNYYVAVDTQNTLDCGWETMVFDCCEDGYILNWRELDLKRYPDEESAIKGHKLMVEKWEKMI